PAPDAPAAPTLYTLPLHDALPIFPGLTLDVQWQALDDDVRGLRTPVLESPARLDAEDVAEPARDLTLPAGALFSRPPPAHAARLDRKSTRLNSSHVKSSYAVFCLK